MQHGFHILRSLSNTQRTSVRALVLLLVFTIPLQASAVTMGKLKGLKGFQQAVLTVALVNKAMREAAENPMDKWRRQNVASAVGLLPLAITQLAAEFKQGKLHDGDLQFVQKILGGFVDVHAPDAYDKFMKNPSQGNIPQLGANFPREALAQADSEYKKLSIQAGAGETAIVGYNENAPKTGSKGAVKTSNEVIDLADLISGTSGNQGTGSHKEHSSPSGLSAPEKSGAEKFKKSLDDEIESVEKSLGLSKQTQKPETYRLSVKPKYWSYVPVLRILSQALIQEVHADDPPVAAPGGGEQGDSGCQSCKGGGGGGGGEGGGGGGGGAGDILMGIAAIMAAAAPMVAAAVQADADKKIAKINADTQIQMTEMTAETSKYLADSQGRIAQQQTEIAKDINKANNDEQTKRLNMQLAEVKASREQSYKSELERRAIEKQYNDERIALAEKQADQNMSLARATFNAQLTQAGLSSGFSNVNRGSTGALSVDRVTTTAGATTNARTGGALASAGTGSTPGLTGPNLGSATAEATGVKSTTAAGTAAQGTAFMKSRGVASKRLLASVGDDDVVEEEEGIDPKTGKKKVVVRGVRTLRARAATSRTTLATQARGFAAQSIGVSALSLGTTRESLKPAVNTVVASVTPKASGSDLSAFRQEATSEDKGFAAWKATVPPPEFSERSTPSLGQSHSGGAYNAPEDRSSGRRSTANIYGGE